MSTHLTIERFAKFFAALNGGLAPFAWQVRLCEHVMSTGQWPDVIDAPTGSGKSSVVDVHAFAVAAMATGGARVPRRLIMTIDRRALVDGHYEHARSIGKALAEAHEGVLAEVATALRSLRSWCSVDGLDEVPPIGVGVLRGGRKPSRDWLDDPAACQIIAATPEMWGSRLLFRGYGSTDAARPREAGLLAYDSVTVVDEAHLNGQLLTTARRVHTHAALHAPALGIAPLQVVEMSATPSNGQQDPVAVGVTDEDIGADPVLTARLTRPKPVLLRATPALPVASADGNVRAAAEVFVDEILTMAVEVAGTIGCVVNTVRLAVAITERLKSATLADSHASRGGTRPRVLQLVGRMRPYDIARIRLEHPLLFQHGGDPDVDVLVATQTVEVGFDMDFAGLVTELAPGSAIAQRAGRLNRSGNRPSGPCLVVAPATTLDAANSKGTSPYRWEDLAAAREWLQERATDAKGLAPWTLHPRGGGATPPPARLRRAALHRPEWWNVELWARTSQALFAPIDLQLWLQDDLDADQSLSVVVREGLPRAAPSAMQQLRDAPPRPHELFPASLGDMKKVLDRSAIAYVIRGAEVFDWNDDELSDSDSNGHGHRKLRPGDVVVLDAATKAFTQHVFDPEGSDMASDVAELPGGGEAGRVDFRFGPETPLVRELPDSKTFIEGLREIVGKAAFPEDSSVLVLEHLCTQAKRFARGSRGLSFQELVRASPTDGFVVSMASASEAADFWVVVSAAAQIASDDELRQLSSPRHAVLLDAHQREVGDSAARLGETVWLKGSLIDAVKDAGDLHDEGKADPRFQRALRAHGNASPGVMLAKSGMHNVGLIRRSRTASGLPPGWRHEQLSAAIAWERLREHPSLEHRDLVTRLIGASHGHGRPLFDDCGSSLFQNAGEPGFTAARELYGEAEWDELIDRTHVRWGHWGTAYLEAIVRAADVTVSRRGS